MASLSGTPSVPQLTNVRFRVATPDDAAGVLEIYAPFCDSTNVSFEAAAPSVERMQERIAETLLQYPWLVADIDGLIAGYVYASQHRARAAYRWATDVAVYIGAEHRGCGLARALYHSMFSILRELGFYKAYAAITLPNIASVGLHESVGFRSVAVFPGVGCKLGQWLDVGWWQFELRPPQPNPTEPHSFSLIRDEPSTIDALSDGERLLSRSRSSR